MCEKEDLHSFLAVADYLKIQGLHEDNPTPVEENRNFFPINDSNGTDAFKKKKDEPKNEPLYNNKQKLEPAVPDDLHIGEFYEDIEKLNEENHKLTPAYNQKELVEEKNKNGAGLQRQ